MPEQMLLTLSREERAAVAHELYRYGTYREREGVDVLDSQVLSEPGEPDPPGVTPAIQRMADSHFDVAGECDDLAAAFESDAPVGLTSEAIDNAFAGEVPPEVARIAMFARLTQRRLAEPGVLLAFQDDVRAGATPVVAQVLAVDDLQQLRDEHAQLWAQVAQLSGQVGALTVQVASQREEITALREHGAKRRLLPNLFSATVDAAYLRQYGPSR